MYYGTLSYGTHNETIVKYLKSSFSKNLRILDVGAGDGLWGKILNKQHHIDGVEIFKPYIEKYELERHYNNIYNINILDFEFQNDYYDIIIMGDVLEHIELEDAQKLVSKLSKKTKELIIVVPYMLQQAAYDKNIYQEHKQPDLTHENFLKRYPEMSLLVKNDYLGVYIKKENKKIRLHLVTPFYSIPNEDYDHCAFTGKVKKLSKMANMLGYHTIEYSNGESLSESNQKVMIMNEKELFDLTKTKSTVNTNLQEIGSKHWEIFDQKLKVELEKRILDGDIVCHLLGNAHVDLLEIFPNAIHVETGVGYLIEEFGAFRFFESNAWMHYNQGKHNRWGHNYEWMIPLAFDVDEWEPSYEEGEYLLYFGRVVDGKGLETVREIAKRMNAPIRVVGDGELELYRGKNMQIEGPITGSKNRSNLLKNAKALIMPSVYTEPFGATLMEANLCGTPVIGPHFGSFSELIVDGFNGYKCHTLGDYLTAIELVENLDRKAISDWARENYGLEKISKMYDSAFKELIDLKNKGWYSLSSHRFDKDKKELVITVYAIAKNEEKFAERWAKSMSEADHVVVLDTGSTDNTVEILRNNGVIVIQKEIKPWRFDDARNESLKLIPSDTDIAVCCDLDEFMTEGWANIVREEWDPAYDRLTFDYIDPTLQYVEGFKGVYKHSPSYIWESPIHESLINKDLPIENLGHTGRIKMYHTPDLTKSREFYFDLAEKNVKEDPENLANVYRYFMELSAKRKSEKTIEYGESIKEFLENIEPKYDSAPLNLYIADAYRILGNKEKAREYYEKAINQDVYRNPHYDYILLLYELEDWDSIIRVSKLALNIKMINDHWPKKIIAYEDGIHDILSIAYFHKKEYSKALEEIEKALKFSPQNERYLYNKNIFLNLLKK